MVSLKDQLAGLENPEPEIDPENNYHSSDDESVDESGKRDHYVDVGRSKLRETQLDDEKYKGQKVDRKSLYGYESEESEDSQDDDDQEMNEEESEEESEEEDEEESEEGEEDEEEKSAKQKELKNLMAAEQKKIVNHISSTAKADAEKGAAVQHQMNIYEGALDLRINLQKALGASNVLPVEDYEMTEETQGLQTQALDSLFTLITKISSLRVELMGTDQLETPSTKLSKKRTLDQAFSNIETLDTSINKFRDTTLEKWSRKIQSSSGTAALQSNRFKSLNQTAAVQVGAILADMDRLVKRTQINRSNYKPLGQQDDEEELKGQAKKVDQTEQPYIFDDTDFYRLQLKELVDKRMADSANPSNGVKWAVNKTKSKKNVDTKASKGRKLRYTVQDKIQGFAAPVPTTFPWTDEQRDDLFSSLFGQHVKLAESEEEDNDESDGEAEEEHAVQDGIKLFG